MRTRHRETTAGAKAGTAQGAAREATAGTARGAAREATTGTARGAAREATAGAAREATAGTAREAPADRILRTASELFYREGVHAVGVDLIVERAGVAKTSLYRHFRTKDDLVAAFLQREDEEFWSHWDSVAAPYASDPEAELEAHLKWIGARIARPGYRGCPQLNVAAEFPDASHPARLVAATHKNEMRRRLKDLAKRMKLPRPEELADQLWLVIDGAFTSAPLLAKLGPTKVLLGTARALIASARGQS